VQAPDGGPASLPAPRACEVFELPNFMLRVLVLLGNSLLGLNPANLILDRRSTDLRVHGVPRTGHALAQQYNSDACLSARANERERSSATWIPMSRHVYDKDHSTHNSLLVSHSLRAAYIFNPKAAHTSVVEIFRRASRGKLISHKLELLGLNGSTTTDVDLRRLLPDDYALFTFVREPQATFISGYAEVVGRGSARNEPADRLKLKKVVLSPGTHFNQVKCTDPDVRSKRFAAFLDDVLHCHRLTYDTYHIWPQVVKLEM